MTNLAGQTLGQYKLIRLIGEGGMAAVYQARQESMQRDVAIKVIKTNLLQMDDFAQRFQREAQTVASLSHAHILKVFDYGRHEDIVYLVMELLKGGSLEQLIEQGTLTLQQAATILDQIASALDYAHQKGIIHRDLKPGNVLLDESGSAFLTDFGLAKLLNSSQKLTQSGASMGTPAYMAPEQWKGQTLDARTDVYALGILVYEMLSGMLPFNGDSALSMMYLHMHEMPPALRTRKPDLPAAIESVVEQALAKDPDARFQSAGQMAAAFRAAVENKAPTRTTMAKPTGAAAVGTMAGTAAGSAAKPTGKAATNQTGRQSVPEVTGPTVEKSGGIPLWAGIVSIVVVLGLVGIGAVLFNQSRKTPPIPTTASLIADNMTGTALVGATQEGTPLESKSTSATTSSVNNTNATSTPTATLTRTSTATFTPSPTRTQTATPTVQATVKLVFPTPLPVQGGGQGEPQGSQGGPAGGPQGGNSGPPPGGAGAGAGTKLAASLVGHGAAVNSVAFSSDGKYVASGSDDKTARLWSVDGGTPVKTYTGHTDAVKSVAISSNNAYLLTGSADKTAILWDLQSGTPRRTFRGHTGSINSVSFAPGGQWQYILTASDDMTVRLWDAQSGEVVRTFSGTHTAPINSAAFSADGSRIVTASDDMTAAIWDVQTGAVLFVLKSHTGAVNIAKFLPDDKTIITGGADGFAGLWNAATGKLIRVFDNKKKSITSIDFNPDGSQLMLADSGGLVTAWSSQSGKQLRVMTTQTPGIHAVAFGPPGVLYVATGTDDPTVRLWQLPQPPGQQH